MRITDDAVVEESAFDDRNPYLVEPKKGMELIAKLLPRSHKHDDAERAAQRLDKMLDRDIMSTLREVKLDNALELSQNLMKLSDQLSEYQKIKLLKDKTIVGIGGQFSAGKSCFINSLLGNGDEILLPEDQTPTTSIPTYIVGGNAQEIFAYTKSRRILLDLDAMKAMTHEFFKKYNIGFARFVSNLVIHTPDFPSKLSARAALLDTPGYSKADLSSDVATKEILTDENLAREHLKAADFLIWLMSIENGTINDADLQFLSTLEMRTPILIVLNKADKITQSDRERVTTGVKQLIRDKKIHVFGITAYSSRDGIEYATEGIIDRFWQRVVDYSERKQDVGKTLNQHIQSIESAFDKSIKDAQNQQRELGEHIYQSEDILALRALVSLHNRVTQRARRLRGDSEEFRKIKQRIQSEFNILTR